MDTKSTSLLSAESTFWNALAQAASQRQFVRLEYLTDLNEFIKADVALKQIIPQEEGIDVLELASGDTIPLNRVVSISGQWSPLFPGYANYSCDC